LLYRNILRLYFQMRSVGCRAPAFCMRRAVSELIPFCLNYLIYKVGQCSYTFFHLGTPKIIFTCRGSTYQWKLKQNRGGARGLLKYCQLLATKSCDVLRDIWHFRVTSKFFFVYDFPLSTWLENTKQASFVPVAYRGGGFGGFKPPPKFRSFDQV